MAPLSPALLAGLLAGMLLTAGAWVLGPPPPDFAAAQAALALAALLALESTAVLLPALGYLSGAPCIALALAALPGVGPGVATLLAWVGAGWRAIRSGRGARESVRDLLVDVLPIAAAAAVAGWLGQNAGPLPLAVYLLAGTLLPSLLLEELDLAQAHNFRTLRSRTRLLWAAVALLSPAWVTLSQQHWAAPLWLLPALAGLQFAADRALVTYRAEEREDLRRRLEWSQRQAEQERAAADRARSELRLRIDEGVLRDVVVQELERQESREGVLQTLVRLAANLTQSRSAVVFTRDGEGWLPGAHRTPHEQRLSTAVLAGLKEPVVEEAPGPVIVERESSGRIFPREQFCAGLSLSDEEVLYLGFEGEPRDVEASLAVLATEGRAALSRVSALQPLVEQAARSKSLEASVDRLSLLLDWQRRAYLTEEKGAVLSSVRQTAKNLVDHDTFLFVVRGGEVAAQQPPGLQYQQLAEVMAQGRPLLLEDGPGGRVPPLAAGDRSLLAVPLPGGGFVALGSRRPAAFDRSHMEALELLVLQLATWLANFEAHRQVVEALQRLSESEAQLVQSSKMVAVGQLAAGVAHELNTPLGTVILALDALGGQEDPILKGAVSAANRARDIVAKLLFYSREGRQFTQSTDLNQVVTDTLELFGKQFRTGSIDLQLELAELPRLEVNQNEIQQVLINLLLNARDALLEGRSEDPTIRITTRNEPGRVLLTVEDNGPGVAPEAIDRLFDPFFTTKPVGKGTGLGLSVSQQIVGAHGGRLSFEALEKGARFRVELPYSVGGSNTENSSRRD